MRNIAITGANGKMGRVIAELISKKDDCRVIAGVDLAGEAYSDFPIYRSLFEMKEVPDVIIDFTSPKALDDLITYCKTNRVPLVIATTGYTKDQVQAISYAAEQIPIFFTFNMSLGINLLVSLAQKATRVLGNDFDIEIIEKHHNLKKDAPSGTALMLAEAIEAERDIPSNLVYDRHNVLKPRSKSEIGIHSVRGGTIVGEHEVIFAGHDEVITLSHSANSKEVFAVGAINAAVFLIGKSSGLYKMDDLLAEK